MAFAQVPTASETLTISVSLKALAVPFVIQESAFVGSPIDLDELTDAIHLPLDVPMPCIGGPIR